MWPRTGVVIFKDNFGGGVNPSWLPKTPQKWEWAKAGKFYRLKEPGQHTGGIVRPAEYSLVGHVDYADFTLKCKVRCDAPIDRRYRDIVIIFGYQDDTHFYYAHLSNISDDLHNGIMLIDGDYRRKLSMALPQPILVDKEFHKLEIRRDTASGDIEIYFDSKMVMEAKDKTFTAGKVGLGSMDDVGSFDDFYVKGRILNLVEQ